MKILLNCLYWYDSFRDFEINTKFSSMNQKRHQSLAACCCSNYEGVLQFVKILSNCCVPFWAGSGVTAMRTRHSGLSFVASESKKERVSVGGSVKVRIGDL